MSSSMVSLISERQLTGMTWFPGVSGEAKHAERLRQVEDSVLLYYAYA